MRWIDARKTTPRNGARKLVWIDLRGEHVNDRSHFKVGCFDGAVWRDKHCGRKFDPQPSHWADVLPPIEVLETAGAA